MDAADVEVDLYFMFSYFLVHYQNITLNFYYNFFSIFND